MSANAKVVLTDYVWESLEVEHALLDAIARLTVLRTKTPAEFIAEAADCDALPDPHPLRGRDDVILHPHVAWYSEQAMRGLQAGAPGEVRRVLCGEWPLNVVNKAVVERNRAGLKVNG